jgi:hypothetical protein
MCHVYNLFCMWAYHESSFAGIPITPVAFSLHFIKWRVKFYETGTFFDRTDDLTDNLHAYVFTILYILALININVLHCLWVSITRWEQFLPAIVIMRSQFS